MQVLERLRVYCGRRPDEWTVEQITRLAGGATLINTIGYWEGGVDEEGVIIELVYDPRHTSRQDLLLYMMMDQFEDQVAVLWTVDQVQGAVVLAAEFVASGPDAVEGMA